MLAKRRRYPRRSRPRVDMFGRNLITPTNIRFLREKPQLLGLQNTSFEIKGYTYILTDFLGQGGQGAVYQAHVDGTNDYYAVKLLIWEQSLLTNERLKHRGAVGFLNEVGKMMELQEKSKYIVKFIDATVETSRVFVLGWIIMELGNGDLSAMIRNLAVKKSESNANAHKVGASFTHGRDRKHVWRQLVKCVDVLHGENIVNTDLKPGNFITFDKKVKLGDLGLAKHTDIRQFYTGSGTPAYSAPEALAPQNFTQRAQRVSPKADIWSLGVILYEMTYGTYPQIINSDPVPPGSYETGNQHNSNPPKGKRFTKDPYLRDILYRTLQLNPDNRPDIQQLKDHPYTRGSRRKLLLKMTGNDYYSI